ncbi:hypothetical protein Xedl_03891 [Xenorhabdus eapokensis]|uniref:Uncharacterized protein n=1 Tax=Xenorhabdus eapokensis TaxID=1873482 RepID=A0A1Q5TCL8_9GAMM|nr:hypothetical protein Xedl_03891 [Xenorhabdus eapokensis]
MIPKSACQNLPVKPIDISWLFSLSGVKVFKPNSWLLFFLPDLLNKYAGTFLILDKVINK